MAYAESKKGMTKWQQLQENARAFGTFLYDKEKGEVMGRNAASWGKIGAFFVVFYLCLAAFFAAMFQAFLATMPPREEGPKLTQYLAGLSPLRPFPSHEIKAFDKNNPDSYKGYVSKINSLLKAYKDQKGNDAYDQTPCSFNSTETLKKGQKQCIFDLSMLGPCYSDDRNFTFGYKDGAPCFFMRMNKVFDFVPKPENGLSYTEVKCDEGTIYPKQYPGFPVSFFPYRAEQNWLPPIVALQLNTTGAIKVKCDVYGKNMERSETYLLERGAHNRVRIQIES